MIKGTGSQTLDSISDDAYSVTFFTHFLGGRENRQRAIYFPTRRIVLHIRLPIWLQNTNFVTYNLFIWIYKYNLFLTHKKYI